MTAETTWKRLCPVAVEDPVLAAVERALADPAVHTELTACEAREVYPADVLSHLRELGVLSLFAEAEGEPSRVTMWHAASLNATTARTSGSLAITLGVNFLALLPVYIAASDDLRRRTFERVRGGKLAALLLSEWAYGSDLAGIQTRAVRDGDRYLVSGEKHLINGGGQAGLLVTLARTGDGTGAGGEGALGAPADLSLLVVERARNVHALPRYRTLPAPAADISGVRFSDAPVPAGDLIGGEGQGFSIVQQTLAISRGGVAALAAGAAGRAFELASGYARRRYLYGAPIARLDAIAEHLTRLSALDHLCAALALEAAATANAYGQGAAYFTAAAKLACCDLAEEAVTEGRRVLSSRALLGDLPYSQLVRDVSLYGVFDGTRHVMLGQLEWRLAQMAARAGGGEASGGDDPVPAALRAAPARLVDIAGRRMRPLLPSIAGRLAGLCETREWARPAAEVGAALLDLTGALRAGGAWDADQAIRFEAAEILAGLEAVCALLALGGDEPAVRHAVGWQGGRMAARVRNLSDRAGVSRSAELDEADRRLARIAEEARAPLREELRRD